MKLTALILVSFLYACASHHETKKELPSFVQENVCSDSAISYLNSLKGVAAKRTKEIQDKIYSKMISLEPAVRRCYENEKFAAKSTPFYLCLIVSYNLKGKIEFFNFSTKEYAMSSDLEKCLANLKTREELIGFKNSSIVQPFLLHPIK